jgi:hypothetical protein
MRRFVFTSVSMLAVVMLVAFVPGAAPAQNLPTPPHGIQPPPPPPPPPIKPYKAVAAQPPVAFNDPSFVAFRKSLDDAAQHEDRAALAKLVVDKGFFWIQDKDVADKSKSGIDNLTGALHLDAKDSPGWDILAAHAADPTAVEVPQQKGLYCSPSPPIFDPKAMEALLQQTNTDPGDWGYPLDDGTEVRGAPQSNAPVTDKLGLYLVHVLPDSPPPDSSGGPSFLHIALPSGKTGFVPANTIAPLISDQFCFVKDASGWKLTGIVSP